MTATKTEEGARSFALLLQNIGEGTFHAEVSEALHELNVKLAAHAYDNAKAKGTLTMTLSIEVDREGVVTIVPDVKTKAPTPLRKKGRYWLTAGNNLSPENPKQQKLPLSEVPAPKTRDAVRGDDRPARHV